MGVYHVGPLAKIVEELLGVSPAGPCHSMGSTTPRKVALSEHRQLDLMQHRSPFERNSHQMRTANRKICVRSHGIDLYTVLGQQSCQAISARRTISGDHNAIVVAEQLTDSRDCRFDITDNRGPS